MKYEKIELHISISFEVLWNNLCSNNCAKNKQIEELRRWSMRQNELMKKEKKHSTIERSSFTPGDNRTSKINEAEKNQINTFTHGMAQSNSWRRSSFIEICNANRVTLFKSEATDCLIVIRSHFHYLSHEFFVRFIYARCSLSSLSR